MASIETRVTKTGRKTYKVRFRYGGKECSETFDTLSEARKFRGTVGIHGPQVALDLLHTTAALTAGPSVAELAEQWFAWKEADTDVRSDRTVADYRRDYRNWIAPTLGNRKAITVDEVMVQQWVDGMAAGMLPKGASTSPKGASGGQQPVGRRPLSPKSISDRHMILHGIYAWAVQPGRKLVPHNPCTTTRLPKRKKAPPPGLRPAEWQALAAALRQISSDAADLADFLIATGWRFSEAAALSAYSVEDNGTTVHVTMGRVLRRNAAGEHVIVEDAKSTAGLRRIKLDTDAAQMVRRRLEQVDGDGLVFTTATGKGWHYANFLNRIWKPAVKAAALARQPTPHWLRHTHVYWQILTGKVSLPELQRRLGHSSIQTTINLYGRMIDDVSDDALDAFSAIRTGVTPRALGS